MLHQWFTCVHLLDTYLANLTEDFQLSFTTHQFPSEQHKVVCNQHLHAECGGSATISLEVTTEIHQNIANIRLHSVSGDTPTIKYIHTLCLRMLVEQGQLEVHNTHPVGH